MKIDQIDFKIMQLLRENGRTHNKQIAQSLGLSEGTIGNRINKLLNNDLLKITGLVNPSVFPEKQCIFLAVKIAYNKLSIKIAQEIAKLEQVRSASIVTGQYDILVELFIDAAHLIDFLSGDLAQVDGIVSVESFISLKCFHKWI